MEEMKIIGTLSTDGKEYKINFPDNISISIDTDNDIDLTEFVKILTLKLSDKKKAVLDCQAQEDPKLVILNNTLNEIVESFNSTIDNLMDEETE